MANFNVNEGSSINRPPLFDGKAYGYWRDKMKLFVEFNNLELWDRIENGDKWPQTSSIKEDGSIEYQDIPKAQWTREHKEMVQLNSKAKYLLICALSKHEYDKIISCDSAKEIWDRLELLHDGTNEVKESKLDMLRTKYELFKMLDGENIDAMITRFLHIINNMKDLGCIIPNVEMVRKVLRSLSSKWLPKVTAIMEAKDLNVLSLDALIGSLKVHEIELQNISNASVSTFDSLALKSSKRKKKVKALVSKQEASSDDSSSSSSDESSTSDDEALDSDDMALLIKGFSKVFNKTRRRKFNNKRKMTSKTQGKQEEIKCYNCNEKGHIKPNCPKLTTNAKGKSKKKAYIASLSDDDELQVDESNLCFMAIDDDSSEDEDDQQEVSFNALQDMYDNLLDKSNELLKKFTKLNKAHNSLKEKFSKSESALESSKSTIDLLEHEKGALKLSIVDYEKWLEMSKCTISEFHQDIATLNDNISSLEATIESLKLENEKITLENKALVKGKDVIQIDNVAEILNSSHENCIAKDIHDALLLENASLRKDLENFVTSSKCLNMMLGKQKSSSDTHGLGYQGENFEKQNIKFVPPKDLKSKVHENAKTSDLPKLLTNVSHDFSMKPKHVGLGYRGDNVHIHGRNDFYNHHAPSWNKNTFTIKFSQKPVLHPYWSETVLPWKNSKRFSNSKLGNYVKLQGVRNPTRQISGHSNTPTIFNDFYKNRGRGWNRQSKFWYDDHLSPHMFASTNHSKWIPNFKLGNYVKFQDVRNPPKQIPGHSDNRMIFNDFSKKTGRYWKNNPKFVHDSLNAYFNFQHASNSFVSHYKGPRYIGNTVPKVPRTNQKGSKKFWIPKDHVKLFSALYAKYGDKAKEMVYRLGVLSTHDGAQGVLPKPQT